MFFHGFGLARVESLLCLILALFFFVRVLPPVAIARPPRNLSQEFVERLPIVRFPSRR
jgi:hypothetical protein